jgi:hypothetical protein
MCAVVTRFMRRLPCCSESRQSSRRILPSTASAESSAPILAQWLPLDVDAFSLSGSSLTIRRRRTGTLLIFSDHDVSFGGGAHCA